jgi:hypothetical protein
MELGILIGPPLPFELDGTGFCSLFGECEGILGTFNQVAVEC